MNQTHLDIPHDTKSVKNIDALLFQDCIQSSGTKIQKKNPRNNEYLCNTKSIRYLEAKTFKQIKITKYIKK